MISRFTLLCFCALCFYCCNSKKGMQKTTTNTNTSEMKEAAAFDVSTTTKLFQSDLKKVMAEGGELPADFIKKYNLVKMDDQYFAKGFIQTTEGWNPQSLANLGIKAGASSGKMTTVSIPLDQFDAFLGLAGISYFQLTETVNPKKQ